MNERIQQLALQAHVTVLTTKGMEDIVDGCYIISPDKLDKFAELIVRECAEWMDAEQDEKGDGISDNFYWSARMRLHFGVEE